MFSGLRVESLVAAFKDSLDMPLHLTTTASYNFSYRLQSLTVPALALNGADANMLGLQLTTAPANFNQTSLLTQFDSERLRRTGLTELGQLSGSESGAGGRYSRFMDASIDYAYRSGNYFGRWNGFFTSSMLVSALEITRKIRKAPWF